MLRLIILAFLSQAILGSDVKESDFGVVTKAFLERVRELNKCMEDGFFYSPHDEPQTGMNSFELNDWMLNINLTQFNSTGSNDFEVVKSVYDKDTKHYELHIRYDGPTILKGVYTLDSSMNISMFGIDIHQPDYEFKIETFPFIFKIEWTFAHNATGYLYVKDLEYKLDPVDNTDRLTISEVPEFLNMTPETFIELRENIWPIFAEYVGLVHGTLTSLLEEVMNVFVDDFQTVEEFAKLFDANERDSFYGYLAFVEMMVCKNMTFDYDYEAQK